MEYKYKIESDRPLSDLEVELIAFRANANPITGCGLGRAAHFWNIVDMLWGKLTQKMFGQPPQIEFKKNPWAERSIAYAAEHKHLAVLGCANSSKTFVFAAWAIVNWLASPGKTMVLVTSTSLKESRRRIWGSIVDLFLAAPKMPGRLIESQGTIRTEEGMQTFSDKCGIFLVAGERRKERELVRKFIGSKQERVLLIADELPDLSESVTTAAFSNLIVNPEFQLIGIGNFASILDPLGKLSKPKAGWESVTPEDTEWETDYGWCIRFDGLKSPNILSGKDQFPEIYNNSDLANHKRHLGGENSGLFWRMCRSFPCQDVDDKVIYTDADFIRGRAFNAPEWGSEPVSIVGVDPSFSNGGDRFSVCFGQYGTDPEGNQQLAVKKVVQLYENVLLRDEPRDIQLAKQLKELCIKEGIPVDSVAIDASGPGGLAFGSILASVWRSGFMLVKFAGKASETAVSYDDPRKGVEVFVNRRSEVWFAAKDPLRRGQIKGITSDIAEELKQVNYETRKDQFTRMVVESKDEMKSRIGRSPDKAEAFLIMVDLARQRHGFNITLTGVEMGQNLSVRYKKLVEITNDVYSSVDYSDAIY